MNNDHKNNLVALSLALDQLKTRLPDWKFTMRIINNECGTAGCAFGVAAQLWPNAPGVEPLLAGNGYEVTSPNDFMHDRFGVSAMDEHWMWLFSGGWTNRDNTPEGAAARIRWFLKHGIPEDFDEQLFNLEPLCYREGGTVEGAIIV